MRVRPNGAAEFICIGIARSSWLFAKTGYAADTVHHWEFDLEPTSCRFAAGERIRLEIASSAFPFTTAIPARDVPSCRATSWDWRRSTQIVYHTIQPVPRRCICPFVRPPDERRSPRSRRSSSTPSRKSYGTGRLVLQSVDLKVLKGEFVSIIGPSGCGKSTVLKLISGLTPPSAGTIRVDGMTPENARETISFIFQDATLLPWRTVTQNVGLGLELERVAAERRKEKVASLLELVGLGRSPRPIRASFPAE